MFTELFIQEQYTLSIVLKKLDKSRDFPVFRNVDFFVHKKRMPLFKIYFPNQGCRSDLTAYWKMSNAVMENRVIY